MTRWSVLLGDPRGAEPAVLAKWFAARKGIPLFDAQRLARHSWGFLAENLSEAEAHGAAAEARAAGLPAGIVSEDRVPPLHDPVPVQGLTRAGASLVWRAGSPPTDSAPVPAAALRLLTFASLRRDTLVTKTVVEKASGGRRLAGLGVMLTTGIPVGMGGSKEVRRTETSTEWIVFLDVFTAEGRRRVSPDHFDFSDLGGEKRAGGPENIRALARVLHEAAPQALLGRGTRVLLEGKPLNSAGYDDLDDVDKECRWLLALAN
ncbi:MAG: hypothetical protein KA044_02830 [Elusimicrobia bacterium]|nr:hypothetical protein [Elusimicrobiota bacterium]MBP8003960.1 hypothetical protein [Elusimicrobiota bacterium]